MGFCLPDNSKIVQGFAPRLLDGAGTGDWVSMKNYERCCMIVHVVQAHASSGALTVLASTDVGGTNEEAITMKNVWSVHDYVQGTTTAAQLAALRVKETAAATYTMDDTNATSQWWVVDVDAADLGYNTTSGLKNDCVRVDLALSNVANMGSCMYILYNPRYAEAPLAASDVSGYVEPIGN